MIVMFKSDRYDISNGRLIDVSNGRLIDVSNGRLIDVSNGRLIDVSNGRLIDVSNGRLIDVSNGRLIDGHIKDGICSAISTRNAHPAVSCTISPRSTQRIPITPLCSQALCCPNSR
jgi:hypothetical protein